eukprot:CAMPEP_0201718122 /NCGR_PEP_ID=MMETSP0593-20130828/3694_1 /ASSEMBLY_ACC=CAM_ASM_000672 /TAXON_ID=267983 /ORGANISM="Skeletonema japonicum, Strain CCMP2506" /LENGTH=296 /DNA_ID=CAMNT_0048208339 /DNA_START=3 /DNA_END=890 /DNA_ORIENTATION=+
MSEVKEADTSSSSCASCGIAEVDDIKLTECDNCDLVRYCSIKCQKEHKSEHEEACTTRAIDLRDELLFKQPESTHLGDCPICMLPLPIDPTKSTIVSCCSKIICNGCSVANKKASMVPSCPFCRYEIESDEEERDKLMMKRIKANDPAAMLFQAIEEYKKGNYKAAFEWCSKAAALGHVEAQVRLSQIYRDGVVVEKDRGKEMYHLEEATIGGHPIARHNLAYDECETYGNIERAVKHFLIAAKQGYDKSMKTLMELFKQGLVSKEDLAAALRAHQAAVDATKSPQREAAEEFQFH